MRADIRDFSSWSQRGRGRERESGRCSDAVDGFLHTLYIYLYALPTSKSKMSQAACYASRLSVVLDALLSFPTA